MELFTATTLNSLATGVTRNVVLSIGDVRGSRCVAAINEFRTPATRKERTRRSSWIAQALIAFLRDLQDYQLV